MARAASVRAWRNEDPTVWAPKDAVLDRVAEQGTVAQFVSFEPGRHPKLRFSRLAGHRPNASFPSIEDAVRALFRVSPEEAVNVRSFHPGGIQSQEFVYGIRTVREASSTIRRLARQRLYTLANETIDVHDGGVSGVSYGGVCEFAPDDTPRCVEKPGTVVLATDTAQRLFEVVYGVKASLDYGDGTRVEFSLHPLRRGYRRLHVVLWEIVEQPRARLIPRVVWPNHFSRLIGDKAFGLLIAFLAGLPVPRTTVIGRRLAPFTFGEKTGTAEPWIRTSPAEPVPGKFTTPRGWVDPFRIMTQEDAAGTLISSVLAQEGVEAKFSGGAAVQANGKLRIEGVRGSGERFMLGAARPELIPAEVRATVIRLFDRAREALGPVRLEWVFDGNAAWIVQVHLGKLGSVGRVIYPGRATQYHPFKIEAGLEALRELTERLRGTGRGVTLVGDVGVTSHFGDILRGARIPSRIRPASKRKPEVVK